MCNRIRIKKSNYIRVIQINNFNTFNKPIDVKTTLLLTIN